MAVTIIIAPQIDNGKPTHGDGIWDVTMTASNRNTPTQKGAINSQNDHGIDPQIRHVRHHGFGFKGKNSRQISLLRASGSAANSGTDLRDQ
ncbi:MAG: hypothetical protein ABSG31_15405 [Tepidisphaeraceae bacterium]|jgi:hypothetical protein